MACLLAGGMLAPGAGRAAAATSCLSGLPQLQQVLVQGRGRAAAGTVPVLFVHGIVSNAGLWQPSSPGSVAGQAARLPGVTAWTFSRYSYGLSEGISVAWYGTPSRP